MKEEDIIPNILAANWLRGRKLGDLSNTQCQTIFKISGHRCGGTYGHSGPCQDIGYPCEKSPDLEYST